MGGEENEIGKANWTQAALDRFGSIRDGLVGGLKVRRQIWWSIRCSSWSAVRVINEKFKMKHPALRVPPGGNEVDGLPPAFNQRQPAVNS